MALPALFARIKSRYGLEPEAFVTMFEAQGHACAVCDRPLTLLADDLAEAPVVDHDHETGAVRGILCRGCNTAVGYIEKDYSRTRKALKYLKRNRRGRSVTAESAWRQRDVGRLVDIVRPTD